MEDGNCKFPAETSWSVLVFFFLHWVRGALYKNIFTWLIKTKKKFLKREKKGEINKLLQTGVKKTNQTVFSSPSEKIYAHLPTLWWQRAQNQTFSLKSWELDISLFSFPDDDRRGSQGMRQDREKPQRSLSRRVFGWIFASFYLYSAIFCFSLYLRFIFPLSNPVVVILTWKSRDW